MNSPTGRLATRAVLAAAAFTASLAAHDLGRSESTIFVRGADVRVAVAIDLLEVSGVDANADGEVSYSELDASLDRVYAMVKEHLIVRGPDLPVRTTLDEHSVREGHIGQLVLRLAFRGAVSELTVRSTFFEAIAPAHEHQATVTFDGDAAPKRAMLDASSPEAVFGRRATSLPSILFVVALGGLAVAGAAFRLAGMRSR